MFFLNHKIVEITLCQKRGKILRNYIHIYNILVYIELKINNNNIKRSKNEWYDIVVFEN